MFAHTPRNAALAFVFAMAGLTGCGGDTSVCISLNSERNLCDLHDHPPGSQSGPPPVRPGPQPSPHGVIVEVGTQVVRSGASEALDVAR